MWGRENSKLCRMAYKSLASYLDVLLVRHVVLYHYVHLFDNMETKNSYYSRRGLSSMHGSLVRSCF